MVEALKQHLLNYFPPSFYAKKSNKQGTVDGIAHLYRNIEIAEYQDTPVEISGYYC